MNFNILLDGNVKLNKVNLLKLIGFTLVFPLCDVTWEESRCYLNNRMCDQPLQHICVHFSGV